VKARIKPKHIFSKHIREAADEYVREEVDKAKRDELYRFLKVFFVTLNEDFGFGHDRLMKLLLKAENLMLNNQGNEILWDKIDERLIDRLGLPFEREDYEEREKAMLENNARR
jgi:hypothetical protein